MGVSPRPEVNGCQYLVGHRIHTLKLREIVQQITQTRLGRLTHKSREAVNLQQLEKPSLPIDRSIVITVCNMLCVFVTSWRLWMRHISICFAFSPSLSPLPSLRSPRIPLLIGNSPSLLFSPSTSFHSSSRTERERKTQLSQVRKETITLDRKSIF